MSLQRMLGVGSTQTPSLVEARARWADWCDREPDLAVVDDLVDLPAWTTRRDPRTNDVLRALAKIGSPSGGDDAIATTTLCWVLLRGAVHIASRLSDLTPNIDELTASHLWTNAREYDWTKPTKVAPAILAATRRGVQAELGIGEGAQRSDRTWLRTTSVEPDSVLWELLVRAPGHTSAAAARLGEVFEHAINVDAITIDDRDLLIDLAAATDDLIASGVRIRTGRGTAGLLNNAASEIVGRRHGISALHVRRLAKTVISRLHDIADMTPAGTSTSVASA